MNAKLSLHHSEMSEEDLQELVFDLTRSVNQETELIARLPEKTGGFGTKGDAIILGQIVLAAVGSGGALAALLPVLKSYVERKPTLRIEIEMGDGKKLKIEAEHLRPEQIEQTMQNFKQLCDQTADDGNG